MKHVLLQHDPLLLAIAVVICLTGSHTTFRLIEHSRNGEGADRVTRTFAAGATAGAAIWATHFMAMLALSKNMPMQFDVGTTVLSIAMAIVGCSLAAHLLIRGGVSRCIAGGTILGFTISGMHFVGMAASDMKGDQAYVAWGVALSIIIGVALTICAALSDVRAKRQNLVPPALLSGGIVAIHFGAMSSMIMTPICTQGTSSGEGPIAGIVGIVVASIMGMALLAKRAADRVDQGRRDAADRIAHVEAHDPLTGLPNRSVVMTRLRDAMRNVTIGGDRTTLLYLDLDGFKAVNDHHGHGRGDDELRRVADILSRSVREGDLLARMGGDEFVVIQKGADARGIEAICDRIHRTMFDAYEGADATLGVSIGVATAMPGLDVDELVRRADVALYQAKSDGRGTTRFFDSAMDHAARERHAFETDLRQALAREQISIVYQPQLGMDDDQVMGFEVLARWTHPQRGQVPPDRFIPIAERIGVISRIGDWVLQQACQEAASWTAPLRIAVNLSPVQVGDAALPARIAAILEQTGLEPERLDLEVTETAIMRDTDTALRVLQEIKALGVRIAMDDFGTGYSSLSSLHSFPFDKIKVDKSFVSGIETDGKASSIVKAIISLGRSLDLPIVAEGVENAAQLEMLRKEHCTEIQGYLIGKPLPSEAWSHITNPVDAQRTAA